MPIPFDREQLRAGDARAHRQATACARATSARSSSAATGTMGLFPLDAPVDVCDRRLGVGRLPRRGGQGATACRAKVSSWRRISPDSLIPHAKASGQYLNSILAKIESHKAGYEEAILLDDHGHVCEGSGENIFVVRDGDDLHAAADRVDPRRHQPQVGDPDRPRPRLRGRRARHRPRRAVPRRRDLHDRHGRRARARLRGRRPRDRRRQAGRDHARGADRPSTTRCTGATERYREWLDPVAGRRAKVASIQLYDATLRDGMQGEGMSLTRGREAARRPRARRARRPPHRGGLPGVEPQGARALRAARRRALRARADRRVRDDAPPRRRAPPTTRRCACSPTASRRSARSSARRGRCTSRRSSRVSREENLGDDRRLGRVPGRRRASA